jgi:hypothetical protein
MRASEVVRSATIVLVVAGVLTAAACGSEPEPSGVPPSTGVPPGPPSPSGPAQSGPAQSGPASSGPAPSRPGPTEATTPAPPPGTGELPGGLPHGERRATGVVERSGGCVLLRVGSRYWELTGTVAGQLAEGGTFTVAGQVTTATGCAGKDVVRALVVRAAQPG